MTTYKKNINDLLGEETPKFLYECMEDGQIGKDELKGLASELKQMGIFNGYKHRNPFSTTDAKSLFADLLDKVTVNAHFKLCSLDFF